MRDAFAVLFFVSVGMLFDPTILVREPLPVLATVLIIVLGKSLAALLIVLAFRHPLSIALTISVSLAQIGEFSFILAGLGVGLQLLPNQGQDLILAGALLSIMLNPLLFVALDRLEPRLSEREHRPKVVADEKVVPFPVEREPTPELPRTRLKDHAVLVGYGRVGRHIAADLKERGIPFLVIEERGGLVARLKDEGVEVIVGRAADRGLLEAANLAGARWLISAIPNPFEASTLIEAGRAANKDLTIIARAHSDAEVEHLRRYGAHHIVLGEQEIAREMARCLVEGGGSSRSGYEPGEVEESGGDAFERAQRQEWEDVRRGFGKGVQAGPGADAPG
ncbi:MAG TPA: NAD-binding protein [Microvirga sp.]|nr:NAD-binding protein [Microvirga sp.]